ncbi:MAG: DUF1080 domain-containing protein [Flammeovirgaceae bacterium]|nr:DUF1080 domain-containing protein [Flammeovirgaceae bacterium]
MKSTKLILLLLTICIAACSAQSKKSKWQSLFDGKSMDGWRTYQDKENDTWEVKDGALHCKPMSEAKLRADLITEGEYDNFELSLEWKITSNGNSGIMFRVSEEYEHSYYSGPEYQVLDDEGYKDRETELHFTGANYDMHPAGEKKLNPVGQWNETRILVNQNHVEHWLNGQKILEYEIGSDDWNVRKENSKWKNVNGYAVPTKGHIALQDHDSEAWYRNIKIRVIK